MTGKMPGKLAAIGLWSAAAGCQDDLPEARVSGAYVHIYREEDARFCAGSLSYMDKQVVAVSEMFGLEPPQIDFFWVPSDEVGNFCPPTAVACYRHWEDIIVSPDVPQTHELVHAIHGAHDIVPDDFIAEGMATLFSENLPWGEFPTEASIEDLLDHKDTYSNNLPGEFYGRAAHFTWFFLRRYGADRLAQLTRRHLSGRPRAEQEVVMLEVTGENLEEVLAAYRAVPVCANTQVRPALVECGSPLVAWEEGPAERWSAVATIGCERADVLGPVTGIMWTTRSFVVEAAGTYQLTAPGAGRQAAQVVVGRCGSGCEDPFYQTLPQGASEVLDLEAGRYYAMLMRHVDDPGEIGLVVTHRPPGDSR